jgi:hypothetical protein
MANFPTSPSNGDFFTNELGVIYQYVASGNYWKIVSGALTNVITPTITDGDTTHAPDCNAVYDALALKQTTANLETSALDTSTTKYPCNNLVKAVKTTADAALPKSDLESTPTNGATTKAPNSDWAYKIEKEAVTLEGIKTISTDTKLQFRDANSYIFSEAANALNLYSANYIRFNAATAEYIANNNVPLSILNSAGSWKECFKLDSSNLLNIGKDVSVYLPNNIGYVKIGDGTSNAKKIYIDSQSSDYGQLQLGNSNGECSIAFIGHKSAFGTSSTISSSNGNNEIFIAGVGIYNANCLRWAIGNKGYGNWMFAVDYAGQAWFKTAWISIDRQWSDYPSITIHSEANDASKRELRVHGINTSMEGSSSGSDFSVNMVIDGTTYGTSDRRKKTDIVDLKYGLTDLLKLKPVSYRLRNKDLTVEPELRIGFIAQDVIEVIPEAVIYHPDEDVPLENGWCSAYAISDQPILATAIKAIQELATENQVMKDTIAAQQQQINALTEENNSLKQRLDKLIADLEQALGVDL